MKLSEIELKCGQIEEAAKKVQALRSQITSLEAKDKEILEEMEFQKMMSTVTGAEFEEKHETDEIDKTRQEIETLSQDSSNLQKEVMEGFKQLTIDTFKKGVSVNPNSERKVVMEFEQPAASVANCLAHVLNSEIPLKIDNVMLYEDRLEILNVAKRMDVAKALLAFQANIRRLAAIALNENDPEVHEASKDLYEGAYRNIWEAINGAKRISNQDLYEKLNAIDDKDKKKIRNFFTVVKNTWQNRSLFLYLDEGQFELTFFGSLVWRRYSDEYLAIKTEDQNNQATSNENAAEKEKTVQQKKSSLNNFLSKDDIKETLYGTKIT